jgi:hypothetical protein
VLVSHSVHAFERVDCHDDTHLGLDGRNVLAMYANPNRNFHRGGEKSKQDKHL